MTEVAEAGPPPKQRPISFLRRTKKSRREGTSPSGATEAFKARERLHVDPISRDSASMIPQGKSRLFFCQGRRRNFCVRSDKRSNQRAAKSKQPPTETTPASAQMTARASTTGRCSSLSIRVKRRGSMYSPARYSPSYRCRRRGLGPTPSHRSP